MTFIVLLIGVILLAVAYKGTQGQLFSELKTDIPNFGIWAAAIVALGVIGFIPGLKPISRGLLGLVLLVIILNNYSKIIPGFEQTFSSLGGPSSNSSSSTTATSSSSTTATSSDVQAGVNAINVLTPSLTPNLASQVASESSTLVGAGN